MVLIFKNCILNFTSVINLMKINITYIHRFRNDVNDCINEMSTAVDMNGFSKIPKCLKRNMKKFL